MLLSVVHSLTRKWRESLQTKKINTYMHINFRAWYQPTAANLGHTNFFCNRGRSVWKYVWWSWVSIFVFRMLKLQYYYSHFEFIIIFKILDIFLDWYCIHFWISLYVDSINALINIIICILTNISKNYQNMITVH